MAEITKKSSLWLFNIGRQKRVKVQKETQSILLRGAKSRYSPGVKAEDVHESVPTKLYSEFPIIMNWVETIARQLGGELCRVNLVRLRPLGKVYPHIDHGDYYRHRDRFHLILYSPFGSPFICDNEQVRMQQGELWWFNNKKIHEAFNESDEWRIHLIFDLLFSSKKRIEIGLSSKVEYKNSANSQSTIQKLLEESQKKQPRSLLQSSIKKVTNTEDLLKSTEDVLYEISSPEKVCVNPINTTLEQSHFLEEENLTFTYYHTYSLYIAKLHGVILGGKRFTLVDNNGYSILESLPTYYHQPEVQWLDKIKPVKKEILNNKPIYIHDDVAIISNSNFKNYWHWHIQCLSNLTLLDVSGIKPHVTLVIPPLTSWRRRGLQLSNVKEKEAIKVKNTAYYFDVLYFPSLRVKTEQWKTHPMVMETFNSLKDIVLSLDNNCQNISPEKIYVSRLDSPSTRPLENEKELASSLEKKGFTVITPGSHSLEEQILLFSQAKMIVGSHGAGMTNIAYAPPETHVIEIFPRYCFYSEKLIYYTLSQVAGHHYHAFISNILGEHIKVDHLQQQPISIGRSINLPWRLNIDFFLSFLETIE